MKPISILIADDDLKIAELIEIHLKKEGTRL
ncbi:hypothetical protein IIM_01460 [Bacillus cereus VD107]|nr:hypothetical protein IIM_01460 [Bacillus cereus VD107]